MHGPTCIFWANLTPCWLGAVDSGKQQVYAADHGTSAAAAAHAQAGQNVAGKVAEVEVEATQSGENLHSVWQVDPGTSADVIAAADGESPVSPHFVSGRDAEGAEGYEPKGAEGTNHHHHHHHHHADGERAGLLPPL
jgi:hypothetical protein